MTFLSATAGLALLLTIVAATGILCYAVLGVLQRLEVAAVASHPRRSPRQLPPRR